MLSKSTPKERKLCLVAVRKVRRLYLGNIQICWKVDMKEPGLIKYQRTSIYNPDGSGNHDIEVKEYDTSMSNLFFGLVAVSILSLTSVAIARMIFTTPSVVIQQQPQQPARVVSY
jgi:hypothetical protein